MSFQFANPGAFTLLIFAAFILGIGFFTLVHGRRVFEKAFGKARLAFLAQNISMSKRRVKIILQTLSVIVMVVALARPQSGEGRQKAKSEGLELVMVLDVSTSMLAEDVKPSRLGLMQQEMTRLLDSLSGDKVGLVAFAGSAVLLSPLTSDKSALKMYLDSLSPNTVSTQGTEFRKALSEAEGALKRGGLDATPDAAVTKVILVVSDGENHDEKVLELANRVVADGIRVYTMSVGTEKGAPIPMRDPRGEMSGFKRSRDGQVVMTQMRPDSLEKIAEAGHGTYRALTFGGDSTRALVHDFEHLQRSQFETTEVTSYREHFQIILLWGVVLALLEMMLGERKQEGRTWRGRFEISRR